MDNLEVEELFKALEKIVAILGSIDGHLEELCEGLEDNYDPS
jgi:hypothetical protein